MDNDKRSRLGWFALGFVVSLVVLFAINVMYTKPTNKQTSQSPDKPKITIISSVEQLDAIETELKNQQSQIASVNTSLDDIAKQSESLSTK